MTTSTKKKHTEKDTKPKPDARMIMKKIEIYLLSGMSAWDAWDLIKEEKPRGKD